MLQNDRFIEVFVGQRSKPYRVPEGVLTSISEYFVRALRNEDSLGGENGVLRFPADGPVVWQTLLYWKYKGELHCAQPKDTDASATEYVHCWVLGVK